MDTDIGRAELAGPQPAAPGDGGAKRPLIDRYMAANLILWGFTYLLLSARYLGMGTPTHTLIAMGERRAGLCIAAVGLCVLIKRALLATRDWPRRRRLLLAAVLSLAGGVIYTGVNELAFYVIAPVTVWKDDGTDYLWGLSMTFSVLVWSFIAWSATVFALSYDDEARSQTLRLVEAQALAAESQNRMLRYQINPHFLFNTLNALSSLILQKDFARAERMVLLLSTFLRASLETVPGGKTTLAAELDAQRQYLAIEQERFGERLVVKADVPTALEAALVPSLILQPLVENAVKYGVARSTRPVLLHFTAAARSEAGGGETLRVTVRDDAVPDIAEAPQTLGVGLENVRRRLSVLYGAAGALTAGPNPGGGFSATIELPLERR